MLSCAPDGQVKFATKSVFRNKLMEKKKPDSLSLGTGFFFLFVLFEKWDEASVIFLLSMCACILFLQCRRVAECNLIFQWTRILDEE